MLPNVAPVTAYVVNLTQNGTALPAVNVPQSAASDLSGYSLDLATDVPGLVIADNDTFAGSVQPVNTSVTPNLAGPATPFGPLTIVEAPVTVAPGPVQNLTFVQTS